MQKVLEVPRQTASPFNIRKDLIHLRAKSKLGPAYRTNVLLPLDRAATSCVNPAHVRAYAMLSLLEIEGLFKPVGSHIKLNNPTVDEIRQMGGRGDSEGEVNRTDLQFPLGPALRKCWGYLNQSSYPPLVFDSPNGLNNTQREQLRKLSEVLETLSTKVKNREQYPDINSIVEDVLKILEGVILVEEIEPLLARAKLV